MKFPQTLDFTLSETGCVDKEYTKKGTFELIKQSANFVNLYSKELKSNLIILKEDDINEFVYYFPETKVNQIKVSMISEILEECMKDELNPNVPYRITSMTTNEIE